MEAHLNGLPLDAHTPYADMEADLSDVTLSVVADTRSELLDRLATPFGRDPDRLNQTTPGSLFDPRREVIFDDIDGFNRSIGRLQSVEAQRQLVRAAIAMRRHALDHGAYPAERPNNFELTEPDPFTGTPLLYELQAGGSLVLELDGVVELLEQIILKSAAQTVVPIHLPTP